jgi:hypothetical protein
MYLVTYSDKGREMIIYLPSAAMRATGEIALGQDNPNIPFEIVGSEATSYISDNLMDIYNFALSFNVV